MTWHKAQHQQLPGFSLAAHGSRHSSFSQSPEFAGAPWPLASLPFDNFVQGAEYAEGSQGTIWALQLGLNEHLKTYSLPCIQKMSLSLDASGSQLQPNRSQSAQHRIFLKRMPPTKKAKSKGQLLPAIDLAKGPASATWESGETSISKEAVFLLQS